MEKIRKAISVTAFISMMFLAVLGAVMIFAREPQSEIDKVAYAMLGCLAMTCVWKWWE
jgi:hypothetical protein